MPLSMGDRLDLNGGSLFTLIARPESPVGARVPVHDHEDEYDTVYSGNIVHCYKSVC